MNWCARGDSGHCGRRLEREAWRNSREGRPEEGAFEKGRAGDIEEGVRDMRLGGWSLKTV
jgi:hypothetical protein